MRQTIEFRVPEEHAKRFLPPDVGRSVGLVRVLMFSPGAPDLEEFRQFARQLRLEGRVFYTAWTVRRYYSRRELCQADLLYAWPKRVFEPAGEECGTTYDERKACPACGAGARQSSPLFLNGRRIPNNLDVAQTIAGEVVVSRRLAEAFGELSGVEFEAVRLSNKGGVPSEDYFQPRVVGQPVELDATTRAGKDPFDEDAYGRCPQGDVAGLNLLSEVAVKEVTVRGLDVMETRQMVGVRRGLLRPRPMLLLSPRALRVIEDAKLKGFVVEIARLS